MMHEGIVTNPIASASVETARARIAEILGKAIFVSLLFLIGLTAIPYGTSQPWWKAAFVCLVFGLGVVALVENLLARHEKIAGLPLLLPMFVLTAFAFLQSVSFNLVTLPTLGSSSGIAISSDPNETRFVALQLFALTISMALLFRYAASDSRMNVLINSIIAVALASAIFGLLRQTAQHGESFVLPLKPDQGYGQFINKNHFAFLMEMGFGLALGMIVGGGVRREKSLIYVAALLPIWMALVLSNSRGGLVAMLAQMVAGFLLLSFVSVRTARDKQLGVLKFAGLLPIKIGLLILLLVLVILGSVWIGGDRLVSRFDDTRLVRDPTAVSRKEIWQANWNLFKANPIAGIGLGGYWVAIPAQHDASGTLTPQEAHNDYLELLASGGIIGAGIGIWFLAVLLKRARLNLRSSNKFRRAACFAASIGITGVAVHSLFDFGLHKIVNALILVALIVIAVSKSDASEKLTANSDS